MSKLVHPLYRPASERLRIGECTVEVSLREVHAPDTRRPMRITPKAMGVLLMLVENAGKVVGRDALLAQIWPDTLPTNDVLTQAITQLRKAFSEDRENPRYIETIAKSGYRLLAPVEWVPTEATIPLSEPFSNENDHPQADAAPSAGDHEPRPGTAEVDALPWQASVGRVPLAKSILLAAGILAVVAALWLGVRALSPAENAVSPATQQPATPARPYRLITSSKDFEFSPTLSPDGALVAYLSSPINDVASSTIMVQTSDPSQPRELTSKPAGVSDSHPVWSRSGREVAFVRGNSGKDCMIMSVAASGREERVLAPCDPDYRPSFAWTPDDAGLIASSPAPGQAPPGLRVLELATGQWRSLRYGAGENDVDSAPRYSPDGQWIAFIRGAPLGDLWRIPASGGVAEQLTQHREEFRGWDWSPDGRSILYSRRVEGHTRLYRLTLATRSIEDLGIEDAQAPTVALRTPALAFVQRKTSFGLYRVTADPAGTVSQEALFPSSGRDTLPAIAPDGRQLVFTSERSGEFGLWWADTTRPESLRIIKDIRPESRYLPVWSPDSRRILLVGTDQGEPPGLYEINAANGQMQRVPVPVPSDKLLTAAYLPDPARLLVLEADEGGKQVLRLFDRSAKPWRSLAAIEGVSLARLDPSDGSVLFTRLARDGLWRVDAALTPDSIRRVDARYPSSLRYRTWNVDERGAIFYVEQGADCLISLREIGAAIEPGRCVQATLLAASNGFSASARSRSVYLSVATEDGSDIGFMPLPVTEARPVGNQVIDSKR
jgi:DNA-binding winged helix-turn-helix (wHTH) protein/Tol biopolymer transport system component